LGKNVVLPRFGGEKEADPSKTWKEEVDKDMVTLHLKPNDAAYHSRWRELITVNWSDSNMNIDDMVRV